MPVESAAPEADLAATSGHGSNDPTNSASLFPTIRCVQSQDPAEALFRAGQVFPPKRFVADRTRMNWSWRPNRRGLA